MNMFALLDMDPGVNLVLVPSPPPPPPPPPPTKTKKYPNSIKTWTF